MRAWVQSKVPTTFCQHCTSWELFLWILLVVRIPPMKIWAWSSNYLENNSSFFVFSTQKSRHTVNKRLLWQHLTTMVIDKIRKMSIKGVKLKSESFFSISPGVLELRRKNLREGVQIGLRLFQWRQKWYSWYGHGLTKIPHILFKINHSLFKNQ